MSNAKKNISKLFKDDCMRMFITALSVLAENGNKPMTVMGIHYINTTVNPLLASVKNNNIDDNFF